MRATLAPSRLYRVGMVAASYTFLVGGGPGARTARPIAVDLDARRQVERAEMGRRMGQERRRVVRALRKREDEEWAEKRKPKPPAPEPPTPETPVPPTPPVPPEPPRPRPEPKAAK